MLSLERSIKESGRRNAGIRTSLVLWVLLLATGAVFCFQPAAFGSEVISLDAEGGKPPVRIGVLAPQTGALASTGEMAMAAMKISPRDLQRMYVHGPVELVVEDTASGPKTALSKLKKLVGLGMFAWSLAPSPIPSSKP